MLASSGRNNVSVNKMYRRFAVAVAEKPILNLLTVVAMSAAAATTGPYMRGQVQAVSDRCQQQPAGQRGECLHGALGKWQLLWDIQGVNFILVSLCAVAVVGTAIYAVWWSRHKAKLLANLEDWTEAVTLVASKARRDSLVFRVSLACLTVSALLLAEAAVWRLLV